MAEADNCYFESRIVYVPSCHTRHMGGRRDGRRGRTDADALQSRLKSKLRSRRASLRSLFFSLLALSPLLRPLLPVLEVNKVSRVIF